MQAQSEVLSVDELALRMHQQELVAGFGLFALGTPGLQPVLEEACVVAAKGLRTGFAKVLRHDPATGTFLVAAGTGWRPGVVGHAVLGGDVQSPAGYAFHTGLPVLSNQLSQEQRFQTPPLLLQHGVRSAINVLIGSAGEHRFGVLEVDSAAVGEFVAADNAFMQALANVLAAAVARTAAEQAKDDLLHEKDLLMREVHHRVKNSLQLVRTLLHLQSRTTPPEVREQLETAAGRIQTISAVHQHLYEGTSVGEADAGAYLRALLADMAGMLEDDVAGRTLELDAEPILLPANALSPLGLVTAELVTNALKYATGRVLVSLRRGAAGLVLAVEDEGTGFPAAFDPAARGDGMGMRLVRALAKGNPATAIQVDRAVPHGRIVVELAL